MNPAVGETITLDFVTQNAAGAPTNADSTPTVQVYENGVSMGLSPTVTNITTGLYQVAIVCTTGNGFEAGKSYGAYVTATIGGLSTSGLLENWLMRTLTIDTLVAAIWAALTSGLTTVGSIGKLIVDNLVSGISTLTQQNVADALKLAPTAGTAATGSVNSSLALIKAKTDLITSGSIEVTSPVDVDGPTVTLIQGDDYYAADGRAVTFTSTEWPNLASATVVLRVGGLYNFSMTVTDNAGTISRDFTRAETAAFVPNTYDYQIIATLANNDVVTLVEGLKSNAAGFTINPRIPTA